MDTSNDYLFALQMQNELIDLTDNTGAECVDLTNSTKSSSPVGSGVIDLTTNEHTKNKKRPIGNKTSLSFKRLRDENSEVTYSVVDHSWETLDPNPDIHGLFLAFNRQYFWSTLDAVTVQWSKRMTVCAGVCRLQNGFCSINLSEPLLKLRPRKDLVETLLHEMIHAYLFLTNHKDHRDRDGHGPEFCKHMYRINVEAGTNISIYHDFHDEVRLYKQHWWKCNGPCQYNKPYFGYVKRSLNRAPGPYDTWWANHQAICGGIFIKIKEPEGYGLKKKSVTTPSVPKQSVKPINKITNFIKVLNSKKNTEDNSEINSTSIESDQQKSKQDSEVKDLENDDTTSCPVCNDSVLTVYLNSHLQNCSQLKEMFGNNIEDKCHCPACNDLINRSYMNEHLDSCNMLCNVFEKDNPENISDKTNYVNCPICDKVVEEVTINEHLDSCNIFQNDNSEDVSDKTNYINCPSCNKTVKDVNINEHLDSCNIFENDNSVDVCDKTNYINCPSCNKMVKDVNINQHLDICIAEDPTESNVVQNQIKCPNCKKIFDTIIELDDHIDDCLID